MITHIIKEGDKPKKEISTLFYGKNNFIKNNRIAFVGCFHNDNTIVYSLPKYCPDSWVKNKDIERAKKHMDLVCAVIDKLRSQGKRFDDEEYSFDAYSENPEDMRVNKLEIAEYIIKDYIRNGLYSCSVKDSVVNGNGSTLWSKTIRKFQPIIDGKNIIYPNRMTRVTYESYNDIMTVIHGNVVNQCIDYASALFDYKVEPVRDVEPLGENLSQYKSVIESRRATVFDERSITLFKALQAWCGSTRYYKSYPGVTCFHQVWEWTNDAVWGSHNSKESDKPKYYINGNVFDGTGNQILDTLRIIKNDGNINVAILDSKYYVPKSLNGTNVEGLPANSDIVKQISYYMFIQNELRTNNINIKYANAFLMPVNDVMNDVLNDKMDDGEMFKKVGYAERGAYTALQKEINRLEAQTKNTLVEDRLLNQVDIIMVDPEKLYNRYLYGDKVSDDEIKNLFD